MQVMNIDRDVRKLLSAILRQKMQQHKSDKKFSLLVLASQATNGC